MENAVTKMQLTAPELIAARDFLRQADMLVDGDALAILQHRKFRPGGPAERH
jgi:hypothetical protein